MLRGSLITEKERTQTLSLTHIDTDSLEHESGKNRSGQFINQGDYWCSYITVCCENIHTNIIYSSHLLLPSSSCFIFFCPLTVSDLDVNMDFSPRGSSKRVSSSTRWRVGSLVPQISLSVMITWESSVSHSPGPSCVQRDISQLIHKMKRDENKWNAKCGQLQCFYSGGG